ncbi:hypothetical protein HPB50_026566 [Hyalomma asiaticum]|uniref:Uncharacterized protein n=1 Tax=Hyalomma asiaticum TaxID=266040 RepID=A0ACB7TP57_HYAAI|nr:hypothetical protein HPB50_026566 [Hyalomma asiaticum]
MRLDCVSGRAYLLASSSKEEHPPERVLELRLRARRSSGNRSPDAGPPGRRGGSRGGCLAAAGAIIGDQLRVSMRSGVALLAQKGGCGQVGDRFGAACYCRWSRPPLGVPSAARRPPPGGARPSSAIMR